jgi:hypothetical protein
LSGDGVPQARRLQTLGKGTHKLRRF